MKSYGLPSAFALLVSTTSCSTTCRRTNLKGRRCSPTRGAIEVRRFQQEGLAAGLEVYGSYWSRLGLGTGSCAIWVANRAISSSSVA
jgi:hypothetical protein